MLIMLRRIASFVFLLLIGFTAQAQIFKVKIADEPIDDVFDLIVNYEGGQYYRFTMIGKTTIFNGVFELLDQKESNGVVRQTYMSRTKLTIHTNNGYEYPNYATILVKAYDQGMYRMIHFNFTFVYDKKTHTINNDLNLVCKK